MLPKSPLGEALEYAINQRSRLELFLSDPRIPIHNKTSGAIAGHRPRQAASTHYLVTRVRRETSFHIIAAIDEFFLDTLPGEHGARRLLLLLGDGVPRRPMKTPRLLTPSRPNDGRPLPIFGRGIPALTCADPSQGIPRVPQGSRLPNGETGLPSPGRA